VLQRTATEDTEVGGHAIRRGERVGMYFASANFDEDVYTNPRRYGIQRTSSHREIRGRHQVGGRAGQPAAGNLRHIDLVGICFAFVDDSRLTHSPGMNFLSHADGIRMWAEILWMTMAKPIRPVVGREIDFGDIPPSLEMIERRETVGKTIIAAPQ